MKGAFGKIREYYYVFLITMPFIFLAFFTVAIVSQSHNIWYFQIISIVIAIFGGVLGMLTFLDNSGWDQYAKAGVIAAFIASIIGTIVGVNRYIAKKNREKSSSDWKGQVNKRAFED